MSTKEAQRKFENARQGYAEAQSRVARLEQATRNVEAEIEQLRGSLSALDDRARQAIRALAGGANENKARAASADAAAARAQLQELEALREGYESTLEQERVARADASTAVGIAQDRYRAAIVDACARAAVDKATDEMLDALALRGIDTARSLADQLGQVAKEAFAQVSVSRDDLARRCTRLQRDHGLN